MKIKRKEILGLLLVLFIVFLGISTGRVEAMNPLTGDNLSVAQLVSGTTDTQLTTISDPMVILPKFGVITFDDYKIGGADTQGSVACGGNFILTSNYNVASAATASLDGLGAVINGSLQAGTFKLDLNNKKIALTEDATELTADNKLGSFSESFQITPNQAINFTDLKTNCISLSNSMASNSTSNATFSLGSIWGGGKQVSQVSYDGTDSIIYVTLSDSDIDIFNAQESINFVVPNGCKVALSYLGTKDITIPRNVYFNETEVQQDSGNDENNRRFIFNAPNISNVVFRTHCHCSVLAPNAAGDGKTNLGGHLSGQLILNSYEGINEVGGGLPFDYTIVRDTLPATPTAAPTATATPAVTATATPAVTATATPAVTATATPVVAPTAYPETKQGNLVVTIYDQENDQKIPNANVIVYSSDGTKIGEYTTNSNGTLTIKNLDEGDYVVKVVSVPDGYTLTRKQISVSVVSGKTKHRKFPVYKKTSSSDSVVKTGDETPVKMLGIVCLISLLGCIMTVKMNRSVNQDK